MSTEEIVERIKSKFYLSKAGYTDVSGVIPRDFKFDITTKGPFNGIENLDWFPTDKKQILEVLVIMRPDKELIMLTNRIDEFLASMDVGSGDCLFLILHQVGE